MNGNVSVCLIGMMGAGKSTVGPLLAEQLERPFIDMDSRIATGEGMSISDIFKGPGEDYFRELERNLLPQILGENVIACGGGILARPVCRTILGGQSTIYLRATIATLEARLQGGGTRPLLPADRLLPDHLRQLLDQRRPYYEIAARWIVDVDDLSPAEVVEMMVSKIKRGSP